MAFARAHRYQGLDSTVVGFNARSNATVRHQVIMDCTYITYRCCMVTCFSGEVLAFICSVNSVAFFCSRSAHYRAS